MKNYSNIYQMLNQVLSLASNDDQLPFGTEWEALTDMQRSIRQAISEAEYLQEVYGDQN
jgi:hypothetical protein